MAESIWFWVWFNVFVLAMLTLDLGVFHRKAHEVKLREAAAWSVVWVVLALAFNAWVWWTAGKQAGLEFLTGYIVEKTLAIDNIFVFVMIFGAFATPALYQHRILFWGIIGALLMRGVLIGVGAYVLERWHWVLYVFGALLVLTALKMLLQREKKTDVRENGIVSWLSSRLPMTREYRGQSLVVREGGKWLATPLLLVLIVVELSDLVFAVDSIPAIFAITKDPFLVFTSNVFAILGLRSMYFLLAGVVHRFTYLRVGLAVVLGFVGVKMLIVEFYKVPTALSLAVVTTIIASSIVVSLKKEKARVTAGLG